MTALARPLRNTLESTVKRGRDIAESAAAEALTYLGVADAEAPRHLDESQRAFRVQLRAHARQLGDPLKLGVQETRRLAEEIAYEQWHRVLFTRFLVENNLLIHPSLQEPISMRDCEELAAEQGKDPWQLASEFAGRMLPQIFRTDDPTQQVELSPNRTRELADLVNGLDRETFLAKDSLGWSYQFWQAKRKDEINKSGVKIGEAELPAVTQLFTEDYMVEFLLHNSLGAWWVSNFPGHPLPVEMPYLRFVDEEVDHPDGSKSLVRRPAAGSFERWPKHLKDFKLLDPCCGSGHFPVFALMLLVPMRMTLEGLTAREAVDAVLRENVYALEVDPRCVEIAAFALALAAWTYPGAGGYRPLPDLAVACSGLSIAQKEVEWLRLASGDDRLREGMLALHRTFKDAPLFGSLIDPAKVLGGDLVTARFDELGPMLEQALGHGRILAHAESMEAVIAAKGLAHAARLLSSKYTLVITNPPYLGRGNQDDRLRRYCAAQFPNGKQDIANAFLERCLAWLAPGGTAQLVMPQNWLFLTSYKKQRENLLKQYQWNLLVRLGEGGFDSPQAAGAFIILITQTNQTPTTRTRLWGLDAALPTSAQDKAAALLSEGLHDVQQLGLLDLPDAVVSLTPKSSSGVVGDIAETWQGLVTTDDNKFVLCHWEVRSRSSEWLFMQMPPQTTEHFTGREAILRWSGRNGDLHKASRAHNFPTPRMLGRPGVAVQRMRNLNVTLFSGDVFGDHVAPLVVRDERDLPALWCFCRSPDFGKAVREVDRTLKTSVGAFLKAEFDSQRWRAEAAREFPTGLPKAYSGDPRQWIFHGNARDSVAPLQVAVARLLGYRWPAEIDPTIELSEVGRQLVAQCEALNRYTDDDGIVCIPAVKGERAAVDRLIGLLGAAFGDEWSCGLEAKLLADAGSPGMSLDAWLRTCFFQQHCKLFHDRPFIWHIWDGQKDGFAALVNYHTLDKARLETLAYTYLGDWIDQQERRAAAKVDGANVLLTAARNLQEKLRLILSGEPPCDIFVRWKPLAAQPLGWDPDLNDGVRVNIRPFMLCGDVGKKGAGVLRDKPNIGWKKDRGTDVSSAPWFHLGPEYGEEEGARINSHHTTLAEKNKARAAKT